MQSLRSAARSSCCDEPCPINSATPTPAIAANLIMARHSPSPELFRLIIGEKRCHKSLAFRKVSNLLESALPAGFRNGGFYGSCRWATGLVGQQIALGLRRQGRTVRALVRGGTRHEKGASLMAAGVEIFDADLTKPETLPGACTGVETILCTATSMPHGKDDGLRCVDHDGTLALIDSAERSG